MEQNRKLDVQCSPGTFQKVQTDSEYRMLVAQHMAGEENYDEIVFTQNQDESFSQPELPDAEEVEFSGECSPSEAKKSLWLDASVKFLISRVKDLRPKVGKTASLKNKKQMWSKISEELCAKGHLFNGVQVEAKFFSLERQYKRAHLHNSKTGRSRQICPFQSELDDLLKEKKAINPEYVLDSETPVTIEDLSSNDEKEFQSSPSENLDPTPSTSKKKKTVLEKFMEKADVHATKREENDVELQNMLKESLKKKEERADRKELLEKKKVELLEKLVGFLQNKN